MCQSWLLDSRHSNKSVVQLSESVILCVDEIVRHASLSQVARQVLNHANRTTKEYVHIPYRALDRADNSIGGEIPLATRENVVDAYERQFGTESGQFWKIRRRSFSGTL